LNNHVNFLIGRWVLISSIIYKERSMVRAELAELFKDKWYIFAFFESGLGYGQSIHVDIVKKS
jgi:hypothetical protein